YEALSYTWGATEGIQRAITVDNGKIQVTPNLHTALCHLRTDKPRLLWIDALCINQNDQEEKAQQIALMGNIYRKAEQVVAFLGE
ncbi:heterokaryon incompatibility, partial [Microdochium trichocladiopsis]